MKYMTTIFLFIVLVPKMEKIIVLLCIWVKEVEKMGNIIKINMYVEMKKEKNSKIKLETLEQNILKYNQWLQMTNRKDMIENYEKFLQAQ
jgi:hypothetical protein